MKTTPPNERGITLVIAVLFILIFMGLTISLSFTSRAETQMANGIKLQQYYSMAASSVLSRSRSQLPDYWVTVDPYFGDPDITRDQWRLGGLLSFANAQSQGEYGGLMPTDDWGNIYETNSGLLRLTYKVWVANNPDDPAYLMEGLEFVENVIIDPALWDMDGKVVLTAEVFAPSDAENPVAVQSALIAVSGSELVEWHKNALPEGDFYGVGNLGRGSAGSAAKISLADTKGNL